MMKNITILGIFRSWKLEKEKSKTLHNIKDNWHNYFLLQDFVDQITYKTAINYRSIYHKTNFSSFIQLVPVDFPYRVVFYCGVGGYYNLSTKTIYMGVHPNTTCANFYNTLYHEQCHIDYGKYIKNMPHNIKELIVDAITYQKYGTQKEDDMESIPNIYEEIDPNRPSTIIKFAQKHNLLIQEPIEEVNVFSCIS